MFLSKAISIYHGKDETDEEDVEEAYMFYQALLHELYDYYFAIREIPIPEFISPSTLSIHSPAIQIFKGWRRGKSAIDEGDIRSLLWRLIGTANAIFAWRRATKDLHEMRLRKPITLEDLETLRRFLEEFFDISFPFEEM